MSIELDRLLDKARNGKISRRDFLKKSAVATGLSVATLSGLMTACGQAPTEAAANEPVAVAGENKYRMATSELGMKCSWCARGADTVKFMGGILGVDVTVFDGELNIDTQRKQLEDAAAQDWSWIQIHPQAIDAFVDPVKAMVAKGIPVIDMDTRLVQDLSTLGVVTFLEPDNFFMGSEVTKILMAAIGSKGQIVHTQGPLGHTGAQGRTAGFHSIIDTLPDIELVDETPCNWDIDLTRKTWDDLLIKYPDIVGGMFDNDDMALAAYQSIKAAGREGQIKIVGVDGMEPALKAVLDGSLLATVVNPTGRVHEGAFWVGYNIATGKTPKETVPSFIRTDGPVIDKTIAPGILYLAENLRI
ncbi:substrate-binding domain-containing protein [bacterium]|nr:MAG: substrate-binding domain-containing protein [bacterium]